MDHRRYLALPILLFSLGAGAAEFRCDNVTYDEGTAIFSRGGEQFTNAKIIPASVPRQLFDVVGSDGQSLARVRLGGQPLKPTLELVTKGGPQACALVRHAANLFARLIEDPAELKAIADWQAWSANREEKACAPKLDSLGYFMPGRRKTAVVVHGIAASPLAMRAIISELLDDGYNVLAPRLEKHDAVDLKALDDADFHEWTQNTEEVLDRALEFSNQVTLVGYSLGGSLVSRMALKRPEAVEKMVLFAPAWRIDPKIDWGTFAGALTGAARFLTFGKIPALSLNEWDDEPEACELGQGYLPASAGGEVESLIEDTEDNFPGGGYPYAKPTAFAHIQSPFLIFLTPGDTATDPAMIRQMCGLDYNCTAIVVPGRDHQNLIRDLSVPAEDGTPMARVMKSFLTSVSKP